MFFSAFFIIKDHVYYCEWKPVLDVAMRLEPNCFQR